MRAPTVIATFARRQRGIVLVVGLVILLVLSLLAVGAMQSTTLEERMVNNAQDQQIAFQLAEAALREAELVLQQPTLPVFKPVTDATATPGYYDARSFVYPPLWKRGPTDTAPPSWVAASASTNAPPAPIDRARAQFLVEEIGGQLRYKDPASAAADIALEPDDKRYFRITARAWGASNARQAAPTVILQSTFKR